MINWLTAVEDYIIGNTDYAILIDGEWGTGKTYSLRSQVEPLVKKHSRKYTYVSLFGIRAVNELAYAIFSELYIPKKVKRALESRGGRAASEVGKTLLRIALSVPQISHEINFPKASKLDIQQLMELGNDIVLCLDDVERCEIPVPEMLGFINRFLERDSLKVILVANTQQIKDERFAEMKEKLVRLTIHHRPDLKTIIPAIISDLPNLKTSLEMLLCQSTGDTNEFCVSTNITNIRTLKFAYGVLAKALNTLSNDVLSRLKSRDVLSLLRFTLAVSNESARGEKSLNELQDFSDSREFQTTFYAHERMSQQNNSKQDEYKTPYLVTFVNKYFGGEYNYVYSSSIVRCVMSGVMDGDSYCREMAAAFEERIQSDKITLLMRGKGHLLSDAEVAKAFESHLRNLTNGDLPLQAYPYNFYNLCYFRRKGLIGKSVHEMKNIFLEGMKAAASKSSCEPMIFPNNYLDVSLLDLGEQDAFKQINATAIALNEALSEGTRSAQVAELKALYPESFDLFTQNLADQGAYDRPIFNYLGVDFLYDLLTKCTNEQLYKLCGIARQLCEVRMHKPTISEERETLDTLIKRLRAYVEDGTMVYSKVLLGGLSDDIEKLMDEDSAPFNK